MDNTKSDDETDSRGKTTEVIRQLAKGLIRDTDSHERRFRASWVDQLLERYRQRPGNPVVHLSDFVGHSQVHFKAEAREIVQPYWNQLVSRDGRWAWTHCRSIANFLKDKQGTPRLKQWRRFGSLTGFDVNSLEAHVDSIRLSDGPYIRMLNRPKLPVNLATPAGARLIGYFFDSNRRNGAFTNKNPALHEDFRRTVREIFGDLAISETITERGGFCRGPYIRTNVGFAVTSALTVAGFDCTQNQVIANNPLPSWMFSCANPIKAESLSAVWDTEGSVKYHDLKFSQGIGTGTIPGEEIPVWPDKKPFGSLNLRSREHVLENPPLLTVSAALLLYSMGIVSRLEPKEVTSVHESTSAYWDLCIVRKASIQAFQAQIRLRSTQKQSKLDHANMRHLPSPPFSTFRWSTPFKCLHMCGNPRL